MPSTTSASPHSSCRERQRHRERAAAVEHAAAAPEREHRRLQQPRQFGDLGAGVLRAAAGDDQDALGFGETLGGRGDRIVVDRRLRRRRRRGRRRDRAALAPHVHRAFERRRSGAARAHRAERVGDQGRGLGRGFDTGRMADNPGDDAGLVADFVQVAVAAADIGLGDLADQRQHRRVGAVGVQERGRGIEQARPRHHGIGLRLAGRERRAQRHDSPRPARAAYARCGCGPWP